MKTLRKVTIKRVEFCVTVPDILEEGVIYVSEEYKCTRHLCLCGCNQHVIMRLGPGEWNYIMQGNGISFTPSILQRMGCKSHYIITDGVANFV